MLRSLDLELAIRRRCDLSASCVLRQTAGDLAREGMRAISSAIVPGRVAVPPDPWRGNSVCVCSAMALASVLLGGGAARRPRR
jgi:hypothetical protein